MLMMKRGNKETPFQFKKGLYRITVYGRIRPYFDGPLRHHTVPSTVPYDKDFNHRRDGYGYRIYGHHTTVNTVTVYRDKQGSGQTLRVTGTGTGGCGCG